MRIHGLAVVGVLLLVPLSACGHTKRSPEALCDVFRKESIRLHDKYESQMSAANGQGDPLAGLFAGVGSLLQAQGDMVVMFERLDRVAPDDIEPDVAAVRDAFKQQAEAMRNAASNPLGAFGAGLLGAIQSSGSWEQVDTYVTKHCDLSFQNS